MKFSNYVGWDIGGAHLKVASVNKTGKLEYVAQFATPLWQGLQELEDVFPETMRQLPDGLSSHVLTMTAELADIFTDRQTGIKSLITICEKKLGKTINLYASERGILNSEQAQIYFNQIASANWHASSVYAASKIQKGLFIDVGSTTTDIIPFTGNKLMNQGTDDQSRLRFDELIYTGVIRTSLMAITNKVPFNGDWQNIAAEHFATMADVYRILGKLQDDDDLMDSADGNSKTFENSIIRLARMLGTDANNHDQQAWSKLAEYFSEQQIQLITNAVLRVLSKIPGDDLTIIGAGVGRFLIKEIADRLGLTYIEFSDLFEVDSYLQHKSNICAPAVALAQLSRVSLIE